MPKLYEIRKFQFFFFANENDEPPHVHVRKADKAAKIWLKQLEWEYNYGFSPAEVRFINTVAQERQQQFIRAYNEWFS